MIHVWYGTQAELIKLAPVLKELAARTLAHRIIDTGQHPAQTEALREFFGLPEPDVRLHVGPGIFSAAAALGWAGRIVAESLWDRRRFRQDVFAPGPGCCVVHGDTLSTLLAALIVPAMGLSLVHVESGLRSFRWLNPFPEEIVRVVANRRADLLFAPGRWACENLRRMKVRGRVVQLPANTGKDALEAALAASGPSEPAAEPYALASIHRYETVRSARQTARAVEIVIRAAEKMRLIWPLHAVTREAIERAGLLGRLKQANVRTCDPLPYADFARLLAEARFVIADGGSIQEESYFLDKPCLLLRHATERQEGLGQNVVLSGWRREMIDEFLAAPRRHRRRDELPDRSPSSMVVDEVAAEETALHSSRAWVCCCERDRGPACEPPADRTKAAP